MAINPGAPYRYGLLTPMVDRAMEEPLQFGKNIGGSLLAGLLGFPGDVEAVGRQIATGFRSGPVAREHQQTFLPTSDQLQSKFGVQAGKPESIAGLIGAPDPMDIARMGSKGLLAMTLFHGTPHKFDRFDLSKIGTGEGAQAYGHGLYFAESKDVAKSYTPRDLDAEDELMSLYKGAEAREDYEKMELYERALMHDDADDILEIYTKENGYDDSMIKKAEEVAYTLRRIEPKGGHLYEVDIPDETIDKMLDWDAPLKPDSPLATAASSVADSIPDGIVAEVMRDEGITGFASGGDLYRSMAADLGNDAAASDVLRIEAGIPGIRYFDGSSRRAGEGTRNIVLFNPDDIRQAKRDGEVVFNRAIK